MSMELLCAGFPTAISLHTQGFEHRIFGAFVLPQKELRDIERHPSEYLLTNSETLFQITLTFFFDFALNILRPLSQEKQEKSDETGQKSEKQELIHEFVKNIALNLTLTLISFRMIST